MFFRDLCETAIPGFATCTPALLEVVPPGRLIGLQNSDTPLSSNCLIWSKKSSPCSSTNPTAACGVNPSRTIAALQATSSAIAYQRSNGHVFWGRDGQELSKKEQFSFLISLRTSHNTSLRTSSKIILSS